MAINGVDLHLEDGEILGLLGPNGFRGKRPSSTLSQAVLDRIAAGSGSAGRDITTAGCAAICQMGLPGTFQITRPFAHLSVLENVKLGRAYGSRPRRPWKQAQSEGV